MKSPSNTCAWVPPGLHRCSVTKSCLTLQPHGLQHARLPCPSLSLRSLPRFLSVESVMPSNHLILCQILRLYLTVSSSDLQESKAGMLKTIQHPTVFGSTRELPPRITFQSLSFFSHALFLGRKTVQLKLEKLSLSQKHPDWRRQTQKEDLPSRQRVLHCADEPGIGWVTLCRNEVLGSQCGCTLLCFSIQLLFICSSNYLRIPLCSRHPPTHQCNKAVIFISICLVLKFFVFLIWGCTLCHVGPQFPNQGSNSPSLHWKQSLNHWTAREVPQFLGFTVSVGKEKNWGRKEKREMLCTDLLGPLQ